MNIKRRTGTPNAFIYNATDTFSEARTFVEFRSMLAKRSSADELDSAAVELWRLNWLHRQRIRNLTWSVRWLVLALIATLASIMITGL